jgi:DNA-binding phage protein
MTKRTFRTLDDVETDYFFAHPEEIDPYIDEIFQEYAKDGDTTSLLVFLRVIAKIRHHGQAGVIQLFKKKKVTRKLRCSERTLANWRSQEKSLSSGSVGTICSNIIVPS